MGNDVSVTKKSPRIVLFLAQPGGALVGKDKPFKDILELCKWAHNECGFEGVSAPACMPFIDIDSVLNSAEYPDVIRSDYACAGTPLVRLEMHTVGQRMLLHPASLPRYKMFTSDLGQEATFREYETAAETEALMIVNASAKLGFKHLVDFSGNRGWTAAKYPWSAYPAEWRLKILLLLLAKHRKVLARCAELGIVRGFELHPEEDLNSPLLLFLLRELAKEAAPETVAAIGALADASHPTLAGDCADLHFKFLHEQRLLRMCHLKDGELGQNFLDADSPEWKGGSIRGDFAPKWSRSGRRFCTFGTGNADWSKIIPILLQVHEEQEEGLDFVVEAECSRFPDMRQGIMIAAENARRAIAGKPLLEAQGFEPEVPIGGNWEDFCTSPVPAEELLQMNAVEIGQVAGMREKIPDKLVERFF
jgi:sugar phosphate isomerase/epimerase